MLNLLNSNNFIYETSCLKLETVVLNENLLIHIQKKLFQWFWMCFKYKVLPNDQNILFQMQYFIQKILIWTFKKLQIWNSSEFKTFCTILNGFIFSLFLSCRIICKNLKPCVKLHINECISFLAGFLHYRLCTLSNSVPLCCLFHF